MENWVIIVDMKDMNVFSVPYGLLKQVFGFMQNNYRAVLFRAYILNAPWSFSTLWSAVKGFLEETTQMKINITSSSSDNKMLEHINPDQLQEIFGGRAQNPLNFW